VKKNEKYQGGGGIFFDSHCISRTCRLADDNPSLTALSSTGRSFWAF